MKVDLPTPGAPEMPMRIAPPVLRQERSSSSSSACVAIFGARGLDQRDRARQRAAVAATEPLTVDG